MKLLKRVKAAIKARHEIPLSILRGKLMAHERQQLDQWVFRRLYYERFAL